MINNDLLADRLNAYKNNEPIPNVETNNSENSNQNLPLLVKLLIQAINFSFVFLKSVSYGFAAKTIFVTDWNFISFLSVGFAFEIILTSILSVFTDSK